MTGPGTTDQRRPLLVNGEMLQLAVEAPSGGGGEKFDPFTAAEAQAILGPQLETAVAASRSLPARLRSPEYLYVEARLLPNYLAASYFPDELLGRVGAVAVGSRADRSIYRTRARTVEEQATRRLVLAVTDAGLAELSSFVASPGLGRQDQQAFDEIRRIDQIALPEVDRVLRLRFPR